MKKGVSIPINTLVMLAVAIIVLLAAVAWFMGAFSPTAQEQSMKQKFDASCMEWSDSNCNPDGSADDVPDRTCTQYMTYTGAGSCVADDVAAACGCIPPYGTARP